MEKKYKAIFGLYFIAAIWAGIILITSGCSDPGRLNVGSVAFGNVHVSDVDRAPVFNDLFDEIWAKIPSYVINTDDPDYANKSVWPRVCSMKVVQTADRIFMRLEWRDFSYNVGTGKIVHVRDSNFLFNGDTIFDTLVTLPIDIDTVLLKDTIVDTAWVQSTPFTESMTFTTLIDTIISNGTDTIYDTISVDTNYYNAGSDQDRFAILWDMGLNGSEQSDCATMCHLALADTTASGDHMYINGGGMVDLWQWQAAMTDPLLKAADDNMSALGISGDQITDSLYFSNYDDSLILPIFMHSSGADHKEAFLHSSDKVSFKGVDSIAWGSDAIDWPAGYIMPGFVLNDNATGSQSDIDAFSGWDRRRGKWILLLSRLLDTGNSDDADLSAIASGDSVMVTISIFDNTDRLHTGSAPFYIVFP